MLSVRKGVKFKNYACIQVYDYYIVYTSICDTVPAVRKCRIAYEIFFLHTDFFSISVICSLLFSWVEQDPEELFDSVVSCLMKTDEHLQKKGRRLKDIAGKQRSMIRRHWR